MALLSVKNLSVGFRTASQVLPVVSDVSFDIASGEVLALVGESGCGKSISCLALTGLLPRRSAVVSADGVWFESSPGEVVDLSRLKERQMRRIRGGGIAYVFQEPSASLNPVLTVGRQIAEVLELHRPEVSDLERETVRLLDQVGIPAAKSRLRAFPHELSGGMQQRVMIAMALAGRPRLLIADEPTTALDVTVQAQILDLLREMKAEYDLSVILVTHNLGIVAEIADNVAVMYAGNIVETAPTEELLGNPIHPYTRALLSAVPVLGGGSGRLSTIPGVVPRPEDYPAGCRFFGRCGLAESGTAEECMRCSGSVPGLLAAKSGHLCRCHRSGGRMS